MVVPAGKTEGEISQGQWGQWQQAGRGGGGWELREGMTAEDAGEGSRC